MITPARLILPFIFLASALSALAQEKTPSTVAAANPRSGLVTINKDGADYLSFDYYDWGPNWSGVARKQSSTELDPRTVSFTYENTLQTSKTPFTIEGGWKQSTPTTFEFQAALTAGSAAELTMAQFSFTPGAAFRSKPASITHADGSTTSSPVPFGRGSLGTDVTRLTLTDADGGTATFAFQPAAEISTDGQARLVIAKDRIEAGKIYPLAFTLTLTEPVQFYAGVNAAPDSQAGWYTFQGASPIPANSEWSLASWLETPAGKHGRITRMDDHLMYNGNPIKLWGLNLSYAACAPDKDLADRRADFYAAMGVNSVRLHKYADGKGWAGIQSENSAALLDPEGLDRMDYFIAALKKRGIYVKLSPVFILKIGPDDLDAIPYAKELGNMQGNRINPRHGSFYISTEIQDLLLTQVTSLLNHTNPYTGLKYADDPAIAFVEIYNEDDALFGGVSNVMAASPTLRKRTGAAFAAWLKNKYKTEAGFQAAWGPQALNNSIISNQRLPSDESFSEGRIYPAGNPWFFDPDNLNTSQAVYKQRLLDTMAFLYELQNEVYTRYTAGIRATGYRGEMITSNWQAGRAMSHFYNLHTDSMFGTIDRHNYFGGGRDQFAFRSESMLSIPGSGSLSASLQQVGNRPFMLSEWIHVLPNEWGVEGPAILGAYGMGLQDWDVSYPFQNSDNGSFATAIGTQAWDVAVPQFIGIFPAVSRQVLRGDVSASPVVHERNVHIPSLASGNVGFDEKVAQQHDIKTFTSDVFPSQALAAARGVVTFNDEFKPTEPFDLAAYTTPEGNIRSATGELLWHPGENTQDGYMTIDTPATQAVVGFAKGEIMTFGDSRIRLDSHYAALYLTAQSPNRTLANDSGILIAAIARARNEGAVVVADTFLLSKGEIRNHRPIGPVVMEPVTATIQLTRPGVPTVHLLDHNGVKTGKTLPVQNGSFQIDTARDQTPYYLIEYP